MFAFLDSTYSLACNICCFSVHTSFGSFDNSVFLLATSLSFFSGVSMTISVYVLLFFSVEDDSSEFLTSLFKIFILKIKLVSEIVKLSSS